MLGTMDSNAAAEAFPGLYRAILDGVAELERLGHRDEAHRIRRAATASYSGPWGDPGRRRLASLVSRMERTLTNQDHAIPERRARLRRPASLGLHELLRRLPSAR